MADKAIHEMISSFAAGCMDKQNFEQFKEYIRSEGELPDAELGELQNVISLLPVILELEKPDSKLKDKLAKKLIGMQDEIKEKIRLTHQHIEPRSKVTSHENDGEIKQEEEQASLNEQSVGDKDRLKEDFVEKAKYANSPPSPTRSYELPPRSKKDLERGNKKNLLSVWISLIAGFVILLAAIGFIYISNTNYKEEITALGNRINTLEGQLQTANDFMNDYQLLIKFIDYNDVKIITLMPVEDGKASGKLLLSFEERKGLLELPHDAPDVSSNQAFQVWLISDGQSYSIGPFIPTRNIKYIEIPNLPDIPRNQIDLVRVTVEPASGSDVPEGPVILVGSLSTAESK